MNMPIQLDLLKCAWENRRLSHAYLFLGQSGTGKRGVCREFAKAVNCQRESFPACQECISCHKIENNTHPDIHYIEKEKSDFIKIGQIHYLEERIALRPFEGRFKIFIITDAESLTEEASNCLLKTLEEPPANSIIILLANDLQRLLPTIVSRCQILRFSPLGRREIQAKLYQEFDLGELNSHLKEKNSIIRQFVFAKDMRSYENQKDWQKPKLRQALRILIGLVRDIYIFKAGVSCDFLINLDLTKEITLLSKKYSFADLNKIFLGLFWLVEGIEQNINRNLILDNLKFIWEEPS
ncbi:MAG: DNA polymerase III subunit delta' [Candidatus Omnitrophica bacterium]|nr:DNA polymerase III subunit delta' [Candidatus Omnitrophota bacterium]